MTKRADKPADYIEHGSDEHAALLGLVKDEKGGWQLEDVTQYGPNATEKFLAQVLRQKISELEHPPTVPDGSPPMWVPADSEVSGIV